MTTEQETDKKEERLHALYLTAYPAGRPSATLSERIAAGAIRSQEKAILNAGRSLRLRLAFAGAGGATLAMCLFLAWPAITAARMLWGMDGAIRDTKSVHSTMLRVMPGKPLQKDSETWYQGGKWRLERSHPRDIQVFAEGKLWNYEPASNIVLVRRMSSPFTYGPSGFSISSLVHDDARYGWKYKIRLLGTTAQNGRSFSRMIIQTSDHERMVMLVDPATDLPLETTMQESADGRWATIGVAEATYNKPLPTSLFVPNFPKMARTIDLDRGRAAWTSQFSRIIASRQVGNRAIVIRDVEANVNGDIFLLFTTGMRPTDPLVQWNMTLTDNQGTVFSRGPWFAPYIYYPAGSRRDLSSGFVIDQEQLEGACFIPGHHPVGARRLSFSLEVPVNLAHKDETLVAAGKISPFQSGPETKVTFTVPIAGPNCDILPDYMPFMAQPLFAEDMPKAEKVVELQAELDTDRDQAYSLSMAPQTITRALGLEYKALACNQQLLALTGDKDNVGTYIWFSIYQSERALGHTDKARKALIQSRDSSLQQHKDFHMAGPMDRDPHWLQIMQACREMQVSQ